MKSVLITGVGKGIGKALMERFLQENYFVIGTYHSTLPSIENPNLFLVQLDLANQKSIQSCVEAVSKIGKPVDILINNAGILVDEEETTLIPEKLRETLEVNLIGTVSFTELVIPLITKGGHIINISSSAGSLTLPITHDHLPYHYPAYKISKTALNMYTQTLSGKLKESAITVSSVHPGWVRTDMGGQEAPIEPEEAARDIYELAISTVETGGFWYKGQKFFW